MAKTKTTKSKATKAAGSVKRAAVYVRVSSERQAEKASPQVQEDDARKYCQERGYTIVKVYRDIEKYRVGKKLVEPSGTRADRPGLRAMLADGAAGDFDVIIAWREDRLYRGVNRAMLDVSDLVKEGAVTIELVKEHYDPSTAVVKAWAAGVELQAKHDRLMMGVANKLESGKMWNSRTPYGYKTVDGDLVMIPEQAEAVKVVWQLYADGEPKSVIRRRLIAMGAKQATNKVKYVWPYQRIHDILSNESYYTGVYKINWGGTVYEIPMTPIIDRALAERVKQRKAQYKKYPAGNLQSQALGAGLVRCEACGVLMRVAKVSRVTPKKRYEYFSYRCINCASCMQVPGCAKGLSVTKLDAELWAKVWERIGDPARFQADIEQAIAERQAKEHDAAAECERLQGKLDELTMRRQTVIAWGLNKIIKESDVQYQLGALDIEELAVNCALAEASLLVGNGVERLREVARIFQENITEGADLGGADPTSEEGKRLQFEFRRKAVLGVVERVTVKADKSLDVKLDYNFASLLTDSTLANSSTSARIRLVRC